MSNINIEQKGPNGPQIKETLSLAALPLARGLAVIYGADEFHVALNTVAGGACLGLMEEDGVQLGLPVSVIRHGMAVAQIGATVTPGQPLASNATGQLVPATAGQAIIAMAMDGNPNAGDYICVEVVAGGQIMPPVYGPAPVTHYVAAGAIPLVPGTAGIGSAGALAMTLAAPAADAQDGITIFITAETSHAHTITTPASGINGADHIVTFATRGDGVTLQAVGGTWNVQSLVGGAALS